MREGTGGGGTRKRRRKKGRGKQPSNGDSPELESYHSMVANESTDITVH